jgi:Cu(I)/Ag(I) efflux system membrane fusion protein
MKRVFFLIAVVALLATGNIYAQAPRHGSHDRSQKTAKIDSNATKQKNVQEVKTGLIVHGSCNMCKIRIEKAAKSVKGTTNASWDLKTQKLQLNFDDRKTSLDEISKALAKVGHDTEKHVADDKIYNTLPQCCKYRK